MTPARPLFRAGVALAALLAALNLLAGLGGGLARLGLPVPAAALVVHGAVLVCGFFGTLIALERAVALQRSAGLLAPLAAGLGGVLAWGAGRADLAAACWGLAALVLAALYVYAGQTRAWSLHLRVELLACVAWAAGTLAWQRHDLAAATLGWMAFLVGTIAAERRELMQFVRLSPSAQRVFVATMCVGAAALLPTPWAPALWWAACAALALWLLRHDIAPQQRKKPGWVGHTGLCLSVGYGWLLLAALLGGLGLVWPQSLPMTALAPHAVLLGFVFAMVFGHAPIILPALARLRPQYTVWARAPLWLMSASLLLRLLALQLGAPRLLAAAGTGHALAVAWFALLMARAVWRGR